MRQAMERIYQENYPDAPRLNRWTVHEQETSRKAGILGELVFAEMYPQASRAQYLSHDFDLTGYRVDVKCKYRTQRPWLDQEASVFAYQLKNNWVDLFYFMSTEPAFYSVWLCGWISRAELLNHDKLIIWGKGDIDRSNGKRYMEKTYGIEYQYCHRIKPEKIASKLLQIAP